MIQQLGGVVPGSPPEERGEAEVSEEGIVRWAEACQRDKGSCEWLPLMDGKEVILEQTDCLISRWFIWKSQ